MSRCHKINLVAGFKTVQHSHGKHDMKRIFVSASLVAIGAASLHADEYAPDFTAMDATKPWTVSGTLRGFYDDNFTTTPNGHKQGSAGFEFSPQGSVIVPLQQTELGLRYTYGLYYYQQREHQGNNPIDQTHQVDLWVDHAFNQRWEGKIQDTFTSQQDPQLTSSGTSLPYRAEGNNIQNVGTISAHTEWSMLFSSDLSYQNTWIDYHQHGATVSDLEPPSLANPNPKGATYAGLLNQIQHSIGVNFNYQYLPDLAFMAGYSFEWTDYTGDEPILLGPAGLSQVEYSKNRNLTSHTFKVGAEYAATANLSILAWAGVSYNDNYNLPSWDTESSTSLQPYVNIVATYTYLPGDYVQVGFSEGAASVATAAALYQQSAVFFASINHQITPKLTGSLIGHYQYSSYVGGSEDGVGQDWYTLGLNLAYAFTPWISADAGYNFYYLTSTRALRGYSRNIGYASVTLSY